MIKTSTRAAFALKACALVLLTVITAACGSGTPAEQASDVKIVGGVAAGDRPFMAGLVARGETSAFCGGTFIARDVVLTAAHCVSDDNTGLRIAGGHKLNKDLGDDKTTPVTKVVVHESYDDEGNDNDIALIFLDGSETRAMNDRIRPATASTEANFPETVGRATVSGWGSLSSGGRYPDELREVEVPIIGREECVSAGGGYAAVSGRQVCAGDFVNGGIDSCQGDSGGPLFAETADGVQVIGIVSWGKGCAGKKNPGVYTRVAAYKPWIQEKLATR